MKCPSKQYPECWSGCPEKPTCSEQEKVEAKKPDRRKDTCVHCGHTRRDHKRFSSDCEPIYESPIKPLSPIQEEYRVYPNSFEAVVNALKAYQEANPIHNDSESALYSQGENALSNRPLSPPLDEQELLLTDEERSEVIQRDTTLWCPTKGEFLDEVGLVIAKAQLAKVRQAMEGR